MYHIETRVTLKDQITDLNLDVNYKNIINRPIYSEKASKHVITIDENERNTFELLLKVVEYFKSDITLRVAGGWVRDKLLNLPSTDIDIAIDNVSGEEFSKMVQQYLKENSDFSKIPTISLTKLNPSQSKHLETAVMKLYNLELNFVQLRAEKYSENSRIPTISVGDPFVDAHRRDFTINSLFYNINNDTIEDYTLKGFSDLKEGYISTPIDPKHTLLEDPLRALRAIRFATTYGFKLSDELSIALHSRELKQAMLQKVSLPRISTELFKMLKGRDPLKAIEYFKEFDMFDILFSIPDSDNQEDKWKKDYINLSIIQSRLCMDIINSDVANNMDPVLSKSEKAVLLHSSIIANFFTRHGLSKLKQHIMLIYKIKFQVSLSLGKLAYLFLLNGHRFRSLIDRYLNIIHFDNSNCDYMAQTFIDTLKNDYQDDYSEFLFILRECKHYWPIVLLFSCIYKLKPSDTRYSLEFETSLINMIKSYGIDKVIHLNSLLNGDEVKQILMLQPGPKVGQALESLLKWQFLNLNATKSDALEFLKKEYNIE